MPGLGLAQAPPRVFYSDLVSGPNTGGQNNAGAYVTVYGKNFGASQGSSSVTVGGGQVAAYPIWSDTKIAFQLGAAAASGNIVVKTSAGSSNGIPFTVQAGNIYFIATNGNDSNNGSYSAPWKTIPHAAQTMQPGDIVYGMNGVAQTSDDGGGWNAALTLRNTWCSTSGSRALVAYPGATVTIGTTSGPASGIRATDSSAGEGACAGGWVFAELQLRGTDEAASTNGPSKNWRFVANDMTCPNGDGATACFESSQSTNIAFYGNNAHDTGKSNASAEYHGVYFSTDSNHLDIGWNIISNAHGGRGLQIHSSPLCSPSCGSDTTGLNQYDIAIHDNVIHDTQCDGMVIATVDPSKGPISVYNNIIYNAGTGPNNPEQTGNWACIYFAGTTNNGSPGGGTADVYSNTMYNCGSFANPPYSDSTGAVMNGGGNSALKLRIRNNIIYQTASSAPYWVNDAASDGVNGSNNLFYGIGSVPSNSYITASLNADPKFVNLSQHDFHLQSGSPAVTAGVTTPQSTDFDGVLLPQGSAYPIGAYALAGSGTSSGVSISVNPTKSTLAQGQTQQFTAAVSGNSNTSVTWSMSPVNGTLSTSGLYTAPTSITSTSTVTITATSVADSSKSASATVTLNPTVAVSVSVSPASASLSASQTKQFTATVSGSTNTAVTWSVSPATGTISTSGLYTAPATISSQQTVTIKATSGADSTKSASATITLTPTATVSVTVNPTSASLSAGKTAQFTATVSGSTNTAVTWSVSPATGTISTSGLYTAPATISSQQTVTIKATSGADSTKSASATITLTPTATVSVSVNPASASLSASKTAQFTATVSGSTNTAVTWSVSPATGTISASGLYTAPATISAQQTVTVKAISAADSTKSASATITLNPPTSATISISPTAASVSAGKTQQFNVTSSGTSTYASSNCTWSVSPAVGTISSAGLYTAPATVSTQQAVTVRATLTSDTTKYATAAVTVVPTASTGQVTLTAVLASSTSLKVTWSAPSGKISDSITLTSPGAPDWWSLWSGSTKGAKSGSFTVNLPAGPGLYEFRYYSNGSNTSSAKSKTVAVNTASFSIKPSPLALSAGGKITVAWTAPSGRPSGWADSIGLFKVGTSSGSPISYVYTMGGTSGTYSVTAPSTAGTYEFRYLLAGNTYVIAALSAPVTVQ